MTYARFMDVILGVYSYAWKAHPAASLFRVAAP